MHTEPLASVIIGVTDHIKASILGFPNIRRGDNT